MSNLLSGDVFEKGSTSLGLVLESGYSYGNYYTILGISGNYFAMNGLSVGLGYRGWFGGDPKQNQW